MNENEKVSYALGMSIASNLQSQSLGDIDTKVFLEGMNDFLLDNPFKIKTDDANKIISDYQSKKAKADNMGVLEEGQKFLTENAKKDGISTTASGLQYEVLKAGEGAQPSATDKVTVHYVGTLIDGTKFDSSVDRGQPATFGLNQVIKGWTEGVQLMKEGSKFRFFIPYEIAYGERGAPPTIPGFATLIFEVELLSID